MVTMYLPSAALASLERKSCGAPSSSAAVNSIVLLSRLRFWLNFDSIVDRFCFISRTAASLSSGNASPLRSNAVIVRL